jgi:predicted DNA-binding protein (MmcQ/YjbR family)
LTEFDAAKYCLTKLGAVESYPFGEAVTVIKAHGKIFALLPVSAESRTISLKCDPNRAIALRLAYPEISAGFHLNKRHWNTLDLTGNLTTEFVVELIDHSYELVSKNGAKK